MQLKYLNVLMNYLAEICSKVDTELTYVSAEREWRLEKNLPSIEVGSTTLA